MPQAPTKEQRQWLHVLATRDHRLHPLAIYWILHPDPKDINRSKTEVVRESHKMILSLKAQNWVFTTNGIDYGITVAGLKMIAHNRRAKP